MNIDYSSIQLTVYTILFDILLICIPLYSIDFAGSLSPWLVVLLVISLFGIAEDKIFDETMKKRPAFKFGVPWMTYDILSDVLFVFVWLWANLPTVVVFYVLVSLYSKQRTAEWSLAHNNSDT